MLADAGIAVNVALAPVLPHITDTPESIEAVVRAARDAGAAKVWHNTLYLHDITRETFFAYLREYRPEANRAVCASVPWHLRPARYFR